MKIYQCRLQREVDTRNGRNQCMTELFLHLVKNKVINMKICVNCNKLTCGVPMPCALARSVRKSAS